MIISDDKQLVVYNDDYKPVNIFSGRKKIAGWKEEEYTGKHIEVEDTYNDVLDVAVQGHHEQDSRNAVWWNQTLEEFNDTYWKSYRDANASISFLNSNEAELTVKNNTISNSYAVSLYKRGDIQIYAGHKYYTRFQFKSSIKIDVFNMYISTGKYPALKYTDVDSYQTFDLESTPTNDIRSSCYIGINCVSNNIPIDTKFYFKNFILVDLTAMFGEGKEPTIEQFRKMYPCDYYPYCAGEWRYANKGQWVNFNQLTISNSTHISTHYDITYTNLGNGIVNIKGKSTSSLYPQIYGLNSISVYKDHIYISSVELLAGEYPDNFRGFSSFNGSFRKTSKDRYRITKYIGDSGEIYSAQWQMPILVNMEFDITVRLSLHDLTQMFGEGNEPTTVEEFKALYPNEYYEYVKSRYEDTGGYYEDGQVVEHIPDTAFVTPFPEMPEEIRCVENPKIEVGSTKAPERFVPTTTEIPFKLYGANGINDECEPCVLVDGEWKCRVTRRWNCVTFDGTEGWSIGTAPIFVCKNRYLIGQTIKNVYNTHGIRVWFSSATRTNIQVHTEDVGNFGTEQEWKDWIKEQYDKGTPLRALYIPETPTIELYDPIPVRTLPINSIIDCDAEMEANVKVVDK